ncbi:Translation elongation factor EF-1 [Plasmodium coatneyi]|uniref:Translation elongation factor EF-1 n=1 Tax=Plasmodium coatneyi TaxID=208452 RepID=A0A1B1E0N1_9APIC|nr:Translation elongation factor EF-1 [Plasmodium coatneyi]ANQ08419.1 Translation elongation factor EF-1 [Plasmodium coatneyi]
MEKVYKVQTNIDDFCMREYNGTNHLCIARRSIATGRKQDTSSIRKLREQVEQKVQQKIKEKQGQKALQTLPPGAGESGHMESQSQASKTEGTPNQGEKAVQTKSNLIEVDPRQHLNIIFIGHVDAGKSTACGNILYILGYVDDRTIEKYEREAKEKNRESWFLAFIMDINEEERQKGKTVEVGRAHFETKDRRFTILDSPGHKNFIPNMISGAAQADIGVLIISARKGEFETGFERGGQTREHTLLARTLGINQLIVAINKMDDPTCNWSEARYDEIQKKITPFIKSCGYNINKDVFFVPISGLTGQNLSDHVSDKNSKLYDPRGSWYDTSKPTLFQILNTLSPPPWDEKGPLRIPLLEGYKDNGIIAIGKIESGTLYGNNMSCTLMPNKLKVKVLNVYLEDDEVPYAKPGENVRVKLLGVEEDQISKGFVLCDSLNPCSVVSEFIGRVAIVELLEHKPIITAGYFCIFHAHTTCEEIQFLDMLEVIDKKSKKKKIKPKFIKNDCIVTAHFLLSNPVCIEVYDKLPQLGRFTLRDQGKTIAIGKILELKG